MKQEDLEELWHLLEWYHQEDEVLDAIVDFARKVGSEATRRYVLAVAEEYDTLATNAREDELTSEAKGWRRYALRLRTLARRL